MPINVNQIGTYNKLEFSDKFTNYSYNVTESICSDDYGQVNDVKCPFYMQTIAKCSRFKHVLMHNWFVLHCNERICYDML